MGEPQPSLIAMLYLFCLQQAAACNCRRLSWIMRDYNSSTASLLRIAASFALTMSKSETASMISS